MAYQVLARKWRPQSFDDVLGQRHITDILKTMLDTGRIHHGYVFSGIRGIGKTTTARILAKALNCFHGPTSTPCNQCEFCREITEGYSIDVEEMDGASHRGVDEVRVLQEDAGYAPSRSRYKVFIIDEVHMLTTPAFNALLKTLEEPPPNVVFIMATTEPWKIPMTILSRCQQFHFKQSLPAELIDLLSRLAHHEGVRIGPRSLALLAKSAGGSVRDAENLFDQVIGFAGNQIEDDDVRYVLGIPDHAIMHEFLTAIIRHRSAELFGLMEQLVSGGYNLRFFCMELMERLRNLMVLKVSRSPDAHLVVFDYERRDLIPYLSHTTLSEVQQWYWLIARAEQNIKFSPHPRLVLEMVLARMAAVRPLDPLDQLQAQLGTIQKHLAVSTAPSRRAPVPQHRPVAVEPSAPPEVSEELRNLWQSLLKSLKKARPALAACLKQAIPVSFDLDVLTIGLHPAANISRHRLNTAKHLDFLQKLLKEQESHEIRVEIVTHDAAPSPDIMRAKLDDHAATAPRPAVLPQAVAPPQPQSESRNRSRKNGKWKRKTDTPRYTAPVQVSVQDIVNLFDGEIES